MRWLHLGWRVIAGIILLVVLGLLGTALSIPRSEERAWQELLDAVEGADEFRDFSAELRFPAFALYKGEFDHAHRSEEEREVILADRDRGLEQLRESAFWEFFAIEETSPSLWSWRRSQCVALGTPKPLDLEQGDIWVQLEIKLIAERNGLVITRRVEAWLGHPDGWLHPDWGDRLRSAFQPHGIHVDFMAYDPETGEHGVVDY